jgi:predicted ATPase/DNA-binding winged helix-turn-helix (wHTH) protein
MSDSQIREIISFGPFTLVPSERLLTKQGGPVELGARSLDILIALLSRPNEVVSKRDLLARVWPGVTVEESSLRFHMFNLRKALGDGKRGARYVTTLTGRGYCFVAPVSRSSDRGPVASTTAIAPSFPHANLPNRLARLVGREDDIIAVSKRLTAQRFVTIVGTGGVGKTTVAVAVAHALAEGFAGRVLFVDLGMLRDPSLVTTTIASLVGLSVTSVDPTPDLVAYFRNRRILLLLDTCEHVINSVAALASQIFVGAPQVHVIATSREALQVEGEHVYRLDSLACPPDEEELTAETVQTYPAPSLFIERAVASGARLDMSASEAATIVRICRKLDGVALAIELAARRVEAHGLDQTAAILDQHLSALLPGPRDMPLRQRTLQATLDWSYGLLTELEQIVLRRLAIFVGHFTLDAALAIVTSASIDQKQVVAAIDSLLCKSMLAARPIGAMMRYRLLDTTRSYILGMDVDDSADCAALALRHATYYRQWLEQHGMEWLTLATGVERASHFAAINNVRTALEWSFGPNGDVAAGIGLAAAAAPVFVAMSLLAEAHQWAQRAILALDDHASGGPEEMRLQAALGVSLIFLRGGREEARLALSRGLAIAEQHGDKLDQGRLLGSLGSFHLRIGECNSGLQYARRCSDLARSSQNAVAVATAHSILGLSLHYAGDIKAARTELEAAFEHGPEPLRRGTIDFGIDGNVLAGAALAMNLWLEGYPTQAVERARQTIQCAVGTDHFLSISTALLGAISVFLWTGDLASAVEHIDMLASRAEAHSFGPYLWLARGFKGEVAIRQGNAEGGVEALTSSLEKLHQAPYELFTPRLNIALIQGLTAMGRFAESATLIDETIQRVEACGNGNCLPELRRVKGSLLLSMGRPQRDAESCFTESLDLSRRQGARAWELRTAIDLAVLWAQQRRRRRAQELLGPIFERFEEGSDTVDLEAAEIVLRRQT